MSGEECAVCGKEVKPMMEDHWEYHYENEEGLLDVDLICSGKCLGPYMDKLEREEGS